MDSAFRASRYFAIVVLVGVFATILGGCAYQKEIEQQKMTIESLEQRNDELRTEVSELNRRNEDLENEIETLTRRRNALRKENESLRNQLSDRTSELEATREQRRQARATIEANKKTMKSLRERIDQLEQEKQQRVEQLKQENRQLEQDLSEVKEASTRREGENVVVSLDSRILFRLGEHGLRTDSKQTLEKISDVLKNYEDRPIVVEGHTDTVAVHPESRFPTNWHLSAARAVSVVQFLTDEQGLAPDRIVAAGYGEHRPVKPNTTAENREQNRRVEIVLYPPNWPRKQLSPEQLAE